MSSFLNHFVVGDTQSNRFHISHYYLVFYFLQSKLETIGIQNSIEVDKMQRRMDELENQLIRMQSIKERSSGDNLLSLKFCITFYNHCKRVCKFTIPTTEVLKLAFTNAGEIGGVGSAEMLKREAAEGSESADLLARPPSTSAGMLAMTLFSSLLDLI